MRTRTTAAAVIAVLALTLSACSSGGDDKPSQPASSSAAASPSVDPAAARKTCVDAWAEEIRLNPNSGEGDEPAACSQVPGDRETLYGEAVRQKIQNGRDQIDECLADPACTELPIG